jgi:hypothetical protein
LVRSMSLVRSCSATQPKMATRSGARDRFTRAGALASGL